MGKKIKKKVEIDGVTIYLADPIKKEITGNSKFTGRDEEMQWCEAAWDIYEGKSAHNGNVRPLNFRLEGPPGGGKNALAYALAQKLDQPLYSMLGHEEMTPEDLVLTIVPDHDETAEDKHTATSDRDNYATADQKETISPKHTTGIDLPLVLRASPLATALIEGGLFFFDEINRIPERSLSPLASLLDDSVRLYSAIAGIWITQQNKDPKATFRFCCALNPKFGAKLPEYIEQRTLPVVRVELQDWKELKKIIILKLQPSERDAKQAYDNFTLLIDNFETLYHDKGLERKLSARQALSIMTMAQRIQSIGKSDNPVKEAMTLTITKLME